MLLSLRKLFFLRRLRTATPLPGTCNKRGCKLLLPFLKKIVAVYSIPLERHKDILFTFFFKCTSQTFFLMWWPHIEIGCRCCLHDNSHWKMGKIWQDFAVTFFCWHLISTWFPNKRGVGLEKMPLLFSFTHTLHIYIFPARKKITD